MVTTREAAQGWLPIFCSFLLSLPCCVTGQDLFRHPPWILVITTVHSALAEIPTLIRMSAGHRVVRRYLWSACLGCTFPSLCLPFMHGTFVLVQQVYKVVFWGQKKSVCYFLDCLVWPITITSEFVPWLLASQSQAITVTVLRPSSELSCPYFQTFCDFTFSQNQHTLLGGGAGLLCDMNLYHPPYSNLSVKGLL